jgi:hypothetical protein
MVEEIHIVQAKKAFFVVAFGTILPEPIFVRIVVAASAIGFRSTHGILKNLQRVARLRMARETINIAVASL